MDIKNAASYVDITQQEFEDWLSSLPEIRIWRVHPQFPSVYVLPLSKNVAIEIQSTLTRREETKGRGEASINMRLASLLTGRILNKKAQGQSHFKRTKNWRTSLHKGVKALKATYSDSAGFYDALAELEPGKQGNEKYQREMLAKITSVPGWVDDDDLAFFHKRVSGGGVLALSQKKELEDILAKTRMMKKTPAPAPQPEQPKVDADLLEKIRKLWYVADKTDNAWLAEFAKSVGTQYKTKGTLSDKQRAVLDKNFQRYRIASGFIPF